MPVCAWCGRAIDPGRVHVYIEEVRGAFDTFDCAEKARRRLIAQARVAAILPTTEAPATEPARKDVLSG